VSLSEEPNPRLRDLARHLSMIMERGGRRLPMLVDIRSLREGEPTSMARAVQRFAAALGRVSRPDTAPPERRLERWCSASGFTCRFDNERGIIEISRQTQ
jgi:hypothetical protein